MRIKNNLLVIICLSLFFSKCKPQNPNKNKTPVRVQNISDSVIQDIPDFFRRKKWLEYFSSVQTLLGIQSLQKGYNEWQIRLWIGHGYRDTDSSQLITFTKEDNMISGML